MELRLYSEIWKRVLEFIVGLLRRYIEELERRHSRDLWAELEEIEDIVKGLERLVDRASKSYEGGWTIFVFNVLYGVLEALIEVLEVLKERVEELEYEERRM
jgi:chaperonin cofactor prefoldin